MVFVMSAETLVGAITSTVRGWRRRRCGGARTVKSDRSQGCVEGPLRGYGTDRQCNAAPLVSVGGGAGQMQDDATYRLLDAGAEFEQPLA